ncbi:aldehyde-activating protein [Leisingera sp. ANG-M1]|uniref:GFA family protein n=1 Tax=Leisingera sp. ANG-M1 TaxID=1577895 RepID=UPI00057CEAFD|nr:GFA family protein [Leisingera sp. ANG-M1]KIC11800.1 aldehyde-activating protein [Leisingera sp. ANG-M1]
MPSKAEAPVTGRCYCGAVRLSFRARPQTVAYCHCSDCRRWTGGPVGAFAAFAEEDLTAEPGLGPSFSSRPGVTRWNCRDCGSPLAAQFDYLPGQTYVPIGILDQADELPPEIHCHEGARLPWLHFTDTLERADGSGRAALNTSSKS